MIPPSPTEADFRRAASILLALGDPSRLKIMWWLAKRDCKVSQLAQLIDRRQQATSHHLSTLRLEGLVSVTRVGQFNVYGITNVGKEALANVIPTLQPA